MTRRWLARLGALCLAAAMSACAHAPPTRAERVLFVGNSLTYRNDLPTHFAVLASAARGAPVEAEMIARGGARIDEHAARDAVRSALASGRYTVLVLQEWGSGLLCDPSFAAFGFDCAASHAAHRALTDVAHRHGVRVALLGTYSGAREPANALADAESGLAASLDAAHADLRDFPALRDRYPSAAWYDADGQHPGPELTLLMAHRLADALYGATSLPGPVDVSFRDYRGDASPKLESPVSAQGLEPAMRMRTVAPEDWARLARVRSAP